MMDLLGTATLTEEEKEQIVTSVIASFPTNLPEALSDDLAIASRDKALRAVVEWVTSEDLYISGKLRDLLHAGIPKEEA